MARSGRLSQYAVNVETRKMWLRGSASLRLGGYVRFHYTVVYLLHGSFLIIAMGCFTFSDVNVAVDVLLWPGILTIISYTLLRCYSKLNQIMAYFNVYNRAFNLVVGNLLRMPEFYVNANEVCIT